MIAKELKTTNEQVLLTSCLESIFPVYQVGRCIVADILANRFLQNHHLNSQSLQMQ